MTLTHEEISELLKLVSLTKEQEIDCEACLEQVAEYAEMQLRGKSVSAALKSVQQHLVICSECREEYELLQWLLQSLED